MDIGSKLERIPDGMGEPLKSAVWGVLNELAFGVRRYPAPRG